MSEALQGFSFGRLILLCVEGLSGDFVSFRCSQSNDIACIEGRNRLALSIWILNWRKMKARRGHAKTRGKGNREHSGYAGMKRRFVEEASDSSDEDFIVDEEEEEDEDDYNDDIVSNEEEERTSDEYSEEASDSSKPRKRGVSTRGRAETLRKKPRNRATKRVKILSSEDEEFQPDLDSSTDDSEDDNDDEEVVVSKQSRTRRKRVRKSKNSSTPVSNKRRRRRRKRTTPAARKVSRKQKKIAPESQKSATRRRRTIPVSQNLIRNTGGNNYNLDEDYRMPANQGAKKRRTCSSNSRRRPKLQRRRKVTGSSASDFSDLDSDYTVWEEDNEPLLRSAHCRNPATRLTRSSLIREQEIVSIATEGDNQKHVGLSNSNFNEAEEGLRKKGKEKIEDSLNGGSSELGKPVCGICLSDDGKAYRGKLDCCDHYFCFACIMEWAKVESRCPMCKQRFVSISKSGKGLHGRKISIPLRDQVYQPSEEEIMGILDPYANIVCSECHQAGDDNLLLLCDFCDSAYHTYCVGLGRSVPEGDWYCGGCQTCMPGHSSTQEEDGDDFVLDFHNEDGGSSIRVMVEERPAAGIVEERINSHRILPSSSTAPFTDRRPRHMRTIRRRVSRLGAPNMLLSPPRLSNAAVPSVRGAQASESQSQVSSSGARTLSGQRRLQEHIQVLRDNLNAPERSFLQFRPESSAVGLNTNTSDEAYLVLQPATANRSCMSSEAAQRTNWDTTPCPENTAFKSEVDQAWTMMEHAKALGGGDGELAGCWRVGSYCQGQSTPCLKQDCSELMHNAMPRFISGSSSSAGSLSRSSGTPNREGCASIFCREEILARRTQEVSCIESGNNTLHGTNSSNRSVFPQLLQRNNGPGHQFGNPVSLGVHPNSSDRILLPQLSQQCNIPRHQLNVSPLFDSHSNETGAQKVEGAKDQVQAMVKTYLKPMYRRKQIGNDQFKEIARCCTHTILAACGLEHSRSRVQPIQLVPRCHPEQHSQSSGLMAGCCRDCFSSYVKDVVIKIAGQKLGTEF